jgi:hypothetical protein
MTGSTPGAVSQFMSKLGKRYYPDIMSGRQASNGKQLHCIMFRISRQSNTLQLWLLARISFRMIVPMTLLAPLTMRFLLLPTHKISFESQIPRSARSTKLMERSMEMTQMTRTIIPAALFKARRHETILAQLQRSVAATIQ